MSCLLLCFIQIVKRERKVPEPDPAILQQALKRQEEEQNLYQRTQGAGRSGNGRRGRRAGYYLMSDLVNQLQYDDMGGLIDYPMDWDDEGDLSDYYDDDDDDGSGLRRNDCVIS